MYNKTDFQKGEIMPKAISIILMIPLLVISVVWIMLISVGYEATFHSTEEDKGLSRTITYDTLVGMTKHKVFEAILVIALIASLFIPVYIGRTMLTVKYTQEQYEEAIESAYSRGYDDGFIEGKDNQ